MEEVDLKEIFNMFWSKKVQILIIVLMFLIVGCVYTLKFTTPIYSASMTLILVSSNNTNGQGNTITTTDLTVNSKLISTYNELIKSKSVLAQVISNLNLNETENSLKNNISVSSVENTDLIKVTVRNKNANLSAQIANELAKVFSERVKEVYNINNVQIMDEATIPQSPANINHKKDAIIFTILGFVVSGIYVVICHILDNTIKNAEGIESEFNLPVLASIPNYKVN